MTKLALLLTGLLLLTSATAQEPVEPSPNGVVYGIAIDSDGNPAKGVWLNAASLQRGGLGGRLPQTRTDQTGRYRFEGLRFWGRYIVYADDLDAGYSIFSTGQGGFPGPPPEVTISPEHPEAELNVRLPPRAGFLHVNLTNRKPAGLYPVSKST